jgi:hypothetical protein
MPLIALNGRTHWDKFPQSPLLRASQALPGPGTYPKSSPTSRQSTRTYPNSCSVSRFGQLDLFQPWPPKPFEVRAVHNPLPRHPF